jgi:acyl carrier protein
MTSNVGRRPPSLAHRASVASLPRITDMNNPGQGPSSRSTVVQHSEIADRLKLLLERVIAEGQAGSRLSAHDIDLDADFAELGINSVDLLEFVLGLEQEFDVRVLDDMLPEELPVNLAGWMEVLLRGEAVKNRTRGT